MGRRAGVVAPVVGVALVVVGAVLLATAGPAPGVVDATIDRRRPLTLDAVTTTAPPAPARVESSGIAAVAVGTTDARLAAVTRAPTNPPVALSIDSIGATTTVAPVGVDERGDVAVPPDASNAGWYRFGAVPGAEGSAVVVAHVDYDGRPGPFFRLAAVEPGDVVTVTLADGSVSRFAVTQTAQYRKDELPTAELFRTDGPPRLVLITCGGDFRRAERSYTDNVVVVAEPVA